MQNDVLYNRIMKKIDELEPGGGGGASWDAVIRLVHANNSGPDTPANLSISIVSGSFADLYAKIQNDEFPCILVEYKHLMFGYAYSNPMAYIYEASPYAISFHIGGISGNDGTFKTYGPVGWDNTDSIYWVD